MIRPALMSDLPAIQSCAEAAFAPYVARMGKRPAPMDADYAAAIDAGRAHVLEVEGEFAGFLVAYTTGTALQLETIALRPEVQGKGLARDLMTFAEAMAQQNGCTRITLYTNAAMTENFGFYAALGYDETHRTRQDGFDRVFFKKT